MPSSLDDYEVLETIGTGSYGTCKKIKRKKDAKVLVWKELDYGTMTETEKQLLVSEVNLLRELRHQHIVRYYDRIIDRTTTTLYIIMEYCEGGDVGSLITKLKKEGSHIEEDIVWKICIQVVMALKECHCRSRNGKAVLHRDLKPANVFLDKDLNVKLGDFGLARTLNHETSFARTYVGTPYYMSPEQMNLMSYNEKSDIWSLGCLLYELCALRPPFTANGMRELSTKINLGRFARIPFRYSDDLNKFISFLLQVEEHRRPEISDILDHPYLMKRRDVVITAPNSARSLTTERQSSLSSSDEGYASKVDSLKRREEALQGREEALRQREKQLENKLKKLAQKEKDLETREKSVTLREKIVEERESRVANGFRKDYTKEPRLSLDINKVKVTDSLDDSLLYQSKPLTSCLSTRGFNSSRNTADHKKQVSFSIEKENNVVGGDGGGGLYNMDLPDSTYHHHKLERQFQLAEHTRNMMDINQRLNLVRSRSNEFKSVPNLESRSSSHRQLLGLR